MKQHDGCKQPNASQQGVQKVVGSGGGMEMQRKSWKQLRRSNLSQLGQQGLKYGEECCWMMTMMTEVQ
jgi:hypothetical protein